MLQPLQLEEVSVRHAEAVAELRDFLAKAGSAIGTPESLPGIAARLAHDRAFHRDLTAYIWVLIDRNNGRISYAHLLGVLALAAAGTRFAVAAQEHDAHDLLRFLMDARRTFDTPSGGRNRAPVRVAPNFTTTPLTGPFPSAVIDEREPSSAPTQNIPAEIPSLILPQNVGNERRRVVWAAAACVLAIVSVSVWLHHQPAAHDRNVAASAAPAAPGIPTFTSTAKSSVRPSRSGGNEAAASAVLSLPAVRSNSRAMPSAAARIARGTPETISSFPPPPAAIPPPFSTSAIHGSASPQTSASISSQASAGRPAASVASTVQVPMIRVPAATLSRRLGSPTMPTDASAQADNNPGETSKYPRLLRRKPRASFAEADGTSLVADASAATATSRIEPADTARGGYARPTSLGIMAANLLYSPAPAYPAAASAAHVQGEVKVQADVDRDGIVTSARVISGPALLRDATLDAVRRWRYRPYLSSGRPVSMSAISIIDFQLP